MRPPRILVAVSLLALLASGTGCLFRTRTVEMRTSTAKLQTASKQELLDRINTAAAKVQTLNATVDIATSVGGEKKGTVTDYQEIRGYILVRKPNLLRMIGLFPIVRNKAFDMVSDGSEFKLSIPAKNKFYVGHNNVAHPTGNSLEDLRPQVIYTALLVPEIDPKSDIAVLEDRRDHLRRQEEKEPGAARLRHRCSSSRRRRLVSGAQDHLRPYDPGAASTDRLRQERRRRYHCHVPGLSGLQRRQFS